MDTKLNNTAVVLSSLSSSSPSNNLNENYKEEWKQWLDAAEVLRNSTPKPLPPEQVCLIYLYLLLASTNYMIIKITGGNFD